MALAYSRLSPEFQKRLHGLKAVHSGLEQVNSSVSKGGIGRRDPVLSEHPIVRTHPVTGEKALYVNPQCKHHGHPPRSYVRGTNIFSHPVHRRLQERGIRLPAQVLVRPHCSVSRPPMSCAVEARNRCRLGCKQCLPFFEQLNETILTRIEPCHCPYCPV